jgi:hypothetical protein
VEKETCGRGGDSESNSFRDHFLIALGF